MKTYYTTPYKHEFGRSLLQLFEWVDSAFNDKGVISAYIVQSHVDVALYGEDIWFEDQANFWLESYVFVNSEWGPLKRGFGVGW